MGLHSLRLEVFSRRGWVKCVCLVAVFDVLVACAFTPSEPGDGTATSAVREGEGYPDRDKSRDRDHDRDHDRHCGRCEAEPDAGETDATSSMEASIDASDADAADAADVAVAADAAQDDGEAADAVDDGGAVEEASDGSGGGAPTEAGPGDAGGGDAQAASDGSPTGCLAQGIYQIPIQRTVCAESQVAAPTFCPLFPCTTTTVVAKVLVADDPGQGWVADFLDPLFLGHAPIVEGASGFSASLSNSTSALPALVCNAGSSAQTPSGAFTFSVDCASGTASLTASCMQRGVSACGNGIPIEATLDGSCRNCGAANPSGTSLGGVVAVANGASHACALLADGTVDCWGDSSAMQLGYSTLFTHSPDPLRVPGLSGAIAIAAGGTHTCALLGDGSVWCWGGNTSGELGNASALASATPQSVPGLPAAVAIAAGAANTCALLGDGSVACWGSDAFGQLGEGATGASSSAPVIVAGVSGARALAVGDGHACAVLADGTVTCWGEDANGQLGDGATASSAAPAAVLGVVGATAVAAGDAHSCALLSDGTVDCWGLGASGQLGNGVASGSFTAAPVGGLTGAISVAAGLAESCATLSNGTVSCWGVDTGGFIAPWSGLPFALFGTDAPPQPPSPPGPVAPYGLTQATTASVGQDSACALSAGGTLACWGQNASGQLGTGDFAAYSTPTLVKAAANIDLTTVSNLSGGVPYAGAEDTCSLQGSQVECWGLDANGQLGNGSTTDALSPSPVSGLNVVPNAESPLAVGPNHACAVTGSGLQCWGENSDGELGNDTTTDSSLPVPVGPLTAGGANWSSSLVVAGGHHTCALAGPGILFCWGDNEFGQFGNGTTTSSLIPSGQLTSFTVAQPFVAGDDHTCTIFAGSVYCWGLLSGQVVTSPAPMPSGSSSPSAVPTAIAAGAAHTCAIFSSYAAAGPQGQQPTGSGAVVCWGDNSDGQLGTGNPASTLPAPVYGVTGATAIAAGGHHSCVLLGGSVACWGDNAAGELGDGTTTSSPIPVAVRGISTAVSITAGYFHSCATLRDGRTVCWGDNSHGQLGNGTTSPSVADAGSD
ncbi:MAG TPA: hypothetical protein VGM06_23950 [Polyangiaceae bacterium]